MIDNKLAQSIQLDYHQAANNYRLAQEAGVETGKGTSAARYLVALFSIFTLGYFI